MQTVLSREFQFFGIQFGRLYSVEIFNFLASLVKETRVLHQVFNKASQYGQV